MSDATADEHALVQKIEKSHEKHGTQKSKPQGGEPSTSKPQEGPPAKGKGEGERKWRRNDRRRYDVDFRGNEGDRKDYDGWRSRGGWKNRGGGYGRQWRGGQGGGGYWRSGRNRWGRPRQKNVPDNKDKEMAKTKSPYAETFRGYASILDAKHNKLQRLSKLSQDATVDSKRVVFLLHRITNNDEEKSRILGESSEKLAYIHVRQFYKVAIELDGENPYQFARTYSSGLQEYIEALSFWHYLKHGLLISLEEIQKKLTFYEVAKKHNMQKESALSSAKTEEMESKHPISKLNDVGSKPPSVVASDKETKDPAIESTSTKPSDKENPPVDTEAVTMENESTSAEEQVDVQTNGPVEKPENDAASQSEAPEQTPEVTAAEMSTEVEATQEKTGEETVKTEKPAELVSKAEVECEEQFWEMPSKQPPSEMRKLVVLVPPLDYMLGIADMTGELMRKAISSVSSGQVEMCFELLAFVREIYDGFLFISPQRELKSKIRTLWNSLQKIESACYTITVRGSEIPKHMLGDVFDDQASEDGFQYSDHNLVVDD